MKTCPNWKQPGDSVNGQWKWELLQYLGKTFNLRTLVETGTCEGSTCRALVDDFTDIYTIELSDYYFEKSAARLKTFPNIHRFHGDSRSHLPGILQSLDRPSLIWLDAHSSGGMTADAGDPLAEEIRTIQRLSPDSLVVIDDMMDEELRHVEEQGVSLSDWTREYLTGEVIMYRSGQYSLPCFQKWSE